VSGHKPEWDGSTVYFQKEDYSKDWIETHIFSISDTGGITSQLTKGFGENYAPRASRGFLTFQRAIYDTLESRHRFYLVIHDGKSEVFTIPKAYYPDIFEDYIIYSGEGELYLYKWR
jgi:hypothetical protein